MHESEKPFKSHAVKRLHITYYVVFNMRMYMFPECSALRLVRMTAFFRLLVYWFVLSSR